MKSLEVNLNKKRKGYFFFESTLSIFETAFFADLWCIIKGRASPSKCGAQCKT